MFIDTYELPMASPGWTPPGGGPRIMPVPTHGGVVVHSSPGYPGDDVWALPYDILRATPKLTSVRTYAPTVVVAETIPQDGAAAYQIPVAAGGFAAISAVTMTLKRNAPAAGTLSFEIWDTVGGLPGSKIGMLGSIEADDLTMNFAEYTVWSDRWAWPLFTPGGWLVLNGNDLNAPGEVDWAGELAAVNAHAEWNSGAGTWGLVNGELSATVWQGGDFLIMRGLRDAYCYDTGAGIVLRTLTMDDGSQATGYVAAVNGKWGTGGRPTTADSTGYLEDCELVWQPVAIVGHQGLGP